MGMLFAMYYSLTTISHLDTNHILLCLYLDDLPAQRCLLSKWTHWEDTAYIDTPARDLIRALISRLRSHTAYVEICNLPSNPKSELAKTLAVNSLSMRPSDDTPIFPVIASAYLQGMKLQILNQTQAQ